MLISILFRFSHHCFVGSAENAKRSDSVGSDSLISPSAPSSLIQQPDSYYGSYIEDSFVGDFVGDYMDPSNDHIQENILVMDADGQNLVMMNPNEAISHSHEIEFDFDSFGPESIIYAGNVDAIGEKTTSNGTSSTAVASTNGENGHESHQQEHREDEADNDGADDDDAGKETSNGDDRNTSHTKDDGATLNGGVLEGKRLPGE